MFSLKDCTVRKNIRIRYTRNYSVSRIQDCWLQSWCTLRKYIVFYMVIHSFYQGLLYTYHRKSGFKIYLNLCSPCNKNKLFCFLLEFFTIRKGNMTNGLWFFLFHKRPTTKLFDFFVSNHPKYHRSIYQSHMKIECQLFEKDGIFRFIARNYIITTASVKNVIKFKFWKWL